jgi:hypothetical protein
MQSETAEWEKALLAEFLVQIINGTGIYKLNTQLMKMFSSSQNFLL